MQSNALFTFVTTHPTATTCVLGTLITGACSLLGEMIRRGLKAGQKAIETLGEIKALQVEQTTNHLTHIEAYTCEMRDAQKETNAKLEVLISVISAERGKE